MSEPTHIPASPDGPKTEPSAPVMVRLSPEATMREGDLVEVGIEAAHAACDDLVARAGTDGLRPLAERVAAIRKMLAEAWRDHADDLGATGELPQGKINPEDEGELQLAVGHDQDNVRIEFGKQVAWLAMPRADAVEFARAVMRHAVQLRE